MNFGPEYAGYEQVEIPEATSYNLHIEQMVLDNAQFEAYFLSIPIKDEQDEAKKNFMKDRFTHLLDQIPSELHRKVAEPFEPLLLWIFCGCDQFPEEQIFEFLTFYKQFLMHTMCKVESVETLVLVFKQLFDSVVGMSPEKFRNIKLKAYSIAAMVAGNPASIETEMKNLGIYFEANNHGPCCSQHFNSSFLSY